MLMFMREFAEPKMKDRSIYPDGLAERLKKSAGQSYRPSNGEEGDYFQRAWCCDCSDYNAGQCAILSKTFWFDIGDKNYPPEWIYSDDGQPQCTAFAGGGRR